jgi:outer membrane protein OmpA-like peptidoglycan-associated protein
MNPQEIFMRRSIVLSALPLLALAGCANLPFMHPDRSYVIFFQPNSAAVRAPGLSVITKAAKVAADYPLSPVTVSGAADTVGSTPDNIKLSNARASAVATQLIADGVPATRVSTQGLGAVGSPPASQQASRTATITIGH